MENNKKQIILKKRVFLFLHTLSENNKLYKPLIYTLNSQREEKGI